MKRSNLFKRSAAMLLAGLMAVSMSACGGSSASGNDSGDSQASSSGDTHKLSVVLKTTSSEYWSYVIAGIEQAEKDLGNVEVDVRGANSDTDFDGQLNMVETIVNADMCEAIAIAPLQADQIANALTGVKIPVLPIDTNFDQAETFIGTAHEDAAYEGGKYVAEKIGKGGKVVILANIQGESTSEARVAGYKKALEEGGCEIISTQYTDGVGDKAVTVTDGVLQSFAQTMLRSAHPVPSSRQAVTATASSYAASTASPPAYRQLLTAKSPAPLHRTRTTWATSALRACSTL